MLGLYRFHWDCGRMGELEGLFVANSEDTEEAIGKTVYFGEVLGKHSEIAGTLKAADLKLLTDNREFIENFLHFVGGSGYNPLSCIEGQEGY